MHSIHQKGVTVVTVMTLFFAPVYRGNHWVETLVGKTTETTVVKCQAGSPCPAEQHIVKKVVLGP